MSSGTPVWDNQKAILNTASVDIAFREAGRLGWDNSLHKGGSAPCVNALGKWRSWLLLSPKEDWDIWDGSSTYRGSILPEASYPCYHLCRSRQAQVSGTHVFVLYPCSDPVFFSCLEQSSAELIPDLIFEPLTYVLCLLLKNWELMLCLWVNLRTIWLTTWTLCFAVVTVILSLSHSQQDALIIKDFAFFPSIQSLHCMCLKNPLLCTDQIYLHAVPS